MTPPLLTNSVSYHSGGSTTSTTLGDRNESEIKKINHSSTNATDTNRKYVLNIVWRNVIMFGFLHLISLYGVYLMFFKSYWLTKIWTMWYAVMGGMGITAGAHRLWTHRSYKAKWPLRLILVILQTIAFQNTIIEWSRDHRVHHKFTDTDADPHNSRRGFFFSHIGWLLVRKQPEVLIKGKSIDISDLRADPLLIFQEKYYLLLGAILTMTIPTIVPWYFWNEDLTISIIVCGFFRYALSLNFTWSVNSAAHVWGSKPYDKNIFSTQNLTVAILTSGEGWHNYHHVFPWDYKAAELGNYGVNLTKAFIDFFALIGWAYDLKTASDEMVQQRLERTGDGSHSSVRGAHRKNTFQHQHVHNNGEEIWGWGDKDMRTDDVNSVKVFNKCSTD